jgi:hypothetical protein
MQVYFGWGWSNLQETHRLLEEAVGKHQGVYCSASIAGKEDACLSTYVKYKTRLSSSEPESEPENMNNKSFLLFRFLSLSLSLSPPSQMPWLSNTEAQTNTFLEKNLSKKLR